MLFAVYKPKGPTSNAVLNRIRKLANTKKVGHAGTLDPLAKGVLVVGIGRTATRQLSSIVGNRKEYLGTIRLGATSTTDDAEGALTKRRVYHAPTRAQVKKIVTTFQGIISQRPPKFSAIKVNGKRAYDMARKGDDVQLSARDVRVYSITTVGYRWPYLRIRVVTGKGVYIRSLARDIGNALNVGGYLTVLERTRVGKFTKEKAIRPYELPRFLKRNLL